MVVTIIMEDQAVSVDGEFLFLDFVVSDTIWAVHWDGTSGEVEYRDGSPSETISDFTPYQVYVDAYNTEVARIAAAEAAEAEKFHVRRAGAYPSIEEQLDMQYHDLVNNTTLWADSILAVKTAIPKE